MEKNNQTDFMKILIFGGAGFVGRHYTKFFLEKHNEVTIIDNIAKLTGGVHPKKWILFNPYKFKKKFKFVNLDCRDYFKKNNKKFNLVINLAAIVGGREVIENNPLAVAEDLEIDSSFWRWVISCKHDHIITYSSSAAYPIDLQRKNKFRLLSEGDIDFSKRIGIPDMSYGWAKLTNEYLAKIAFIKYDIKNSVFRPFSGYGFDQDLVYPFSSIIKRAINHRIDKDFIVWGSGKQKRDFIHVSDCIEGSIKISKKIKNGTAVNLSTGKYTDFITLAKIVLETIGKSKVRVISNSNKPEGVFARAGCTKMQKKFGFKPKISIKQGIEEAIFKHK
jgi:nucleoside-diphosphate-sugar epimerase